jgi:hypothetical protein
VRGGEGGAMDGWMDGCVCRQMEYVLHEIKNKEKPCEYKESKQEVIVQSELMGHEEREEGHGATS